jgi:L-ascorbate metabolism protein UlaG (beta-lactamase superfamily)
MFMPLGNDAIVRSAIADARISVSDWGSSIPIGPSATATLTRANHWSNRGLRDRRMALWAGFLVRTDRGNVWFAGDTGYGDGTIFRDMRARYGAPDVALIPIGAYEPRWFMAPQHVDPQAAVRVFQDIGARRALGIHWGTFRLTDEGRESPRQELSEALARAGVDPGHFIAAEPGQSFDFCDLQAPLELEAGADAVPRPVLVEADRNAVSRVHVDNLVGDIHGVRVDRVVCRDIPARGRIDLMIGIRDDL